MLVSEVRRMSKIKRGILFIVILAVFLVTSSVGMEYYVVHQLNGEVTGRNRPFAALTVEPEDTLDMLVAGDSESYNSVSTMRLWEDQGIANTLFRDIGAVKSTQAILEQMGQYYLPVFRYHNLWKTAVDEPKIHTNYKGFVIRDEVAPYEGKPDYMKKKKYVKIYLEKIEELCEKNNAQLLLVSMPSPKNWNHKRHAEMQQYADEKGIAYLDLNEKVEELGLNWTEDTQDKGSGKRNRCRKMIAKEKLNILWSLEQTAEKYADRVAVSDVNQELTWKELVKKAQVIGAELSEKVQPGNPVPVLLEKSSETLAVMLGIVYAGCFYVPVNPMNPAERLRRLWRSWSRK